MIQCVICVWNLPAFIVTAGAFDGFFKAVGIH